MVQIWDMQQHRRIKLLLGYIRGIHSIYAGLEKDNHFYLAIAGNDGIVQIWDCQTHFTAMELSATFAISWPNTIAKIGLSQDKLWVSDHQGTLSCFEIPRKRLLFQWQGMVQDLLTIPGNSTQLLLVHPDKIQLWKTQLHEHSQLTFPKHRITNLALDQTASFLAAGTTTGNIAVWPIYSSEPASSLIKILEKKHSIVQALEFCPDRKSLIAAYQQGTKFWVLLWDIESKKIIKEIAEFSDPISHIAYSPNGQILAIAFTNRQVKLFTWPELQPTHLLLADGSIASLCFSHNGNILALAVGKEIELWNIVNGQRLGILKKHTDTVQSIAFDPSNPEILVSVAKDQTLVFWHWPKYQVQQCISIPNPVQRLGFCGWNKTLVTLGAQELRFYHNPTRELCYVLEGFVENLEYLATSTQSNGFVFGAPDAEIHLYRIQVPAESQSWDSATFQSKIPEMLQK